MILPCSFKLVIHAGDGLLEVAQGAVDLAELPVGRTLPLGVGAATSVSNASLHQLVCCYKSLLVANL